jgi:hypothetical protein
LAASDGFSVQQWVLHSFEVQCKSEEQLSPGRRRVVLVLVVLVMVVPVVVVRVMEVVVVVLTVVVVLCTARCGL